MIGIITVLGHVFHAVLVAWALRAIVRIVRRIAVLRIRVRVLNGLAIGTRAFYGHGHFFAALRVGADLDHIAILVRTGLAVGRGICGVGRLVGT